MDICSCWKKMLEIVKCSSKNDAINSVVEAC